MEEYILMSQKDLMRYPISSLKKIAVKYNVDSDTSKEELTKKLAEHILKDKIGNYSETCQIILNKLNDKNLQSNRKKIFEKFKKFQNNVHEMDSDDLNRLFKEYDSIFFNNQISNFFKQKGYSLIFKIDGESTFTTEGICHNGNCDYIITMPLYKFKEFKSPSIVAGDLCYSQLDSLQKAMEHEMTHLIIFSMCGNPSSLDTHNKEFMTMASDVFKHKDYRHFLF